VGFFGWKKGGGVRKEGDSWFLSLLGEERDKNKKLETEEDEIYNMTSYVRIDKKILA